MNSKISDKFTSDNKLLNTKDWAKLLSGTGQPDPYYADWFIRDYNLYAVNNKSSRDELLTLYDIRQELSSYCPLNFDGYRYPYFGKTLYNNFYIYAPPPNDNNPTSYNYRIISDKYNNIILNDIHYVSDKVKDPIKSMLTYTASSPVKVTFESYQRIINSPTNLIKKISVCSADGIELCSVNTFHIIIEPSKLLATVSSSYKGVLGNINLQTNIYRNTWVFDTFLYYNSNNNNLNQLLYIYFYGEQTVSIALNIKNSGTVTANWSYSFPLEIIYTALTSSDVANLSTSDQYFIFSIEGLTKQFICLYKGAPQSSLANFTTKTLYIDACLSNISEADICEYIDIYGSITGEYYFLAKGTFISSTPVGEPRVYIKKFSATLRYNDTATLRYNDITSETLRPLSTFVITLNS